MFILHPFGTSLCDTNFVHSSKAIPTEKNAILMQNAILIKIDQF